MLTITKDRRVYLEPKTPLPADEAVVAAVAPARPLEPGTLTFGQWVERYAEELEQILGALLHRLSELEQEHRLLVNAAEVEQAVLRYMYCVSSNRHVRGGTRMDWK